MTPMPPTRQSSIEIAACPRAFVEIVVNGRTQPDSIPSERGTEIHHVMSEYVRHCARYKIQADWKYFNSLTIAAGPVAGPILDGLRDRYTVNWETVYGTELTLAIDEEFRPTDYGDNRTQRFLLEPGVNYSGHPAAFLGTCDVIEISPDGKSAKIPDYKSHPSPFEADTYQSVLYPFMLFKHLPALESIIFELVFVRYQNCTRSVEWKRTDMPEMQAIISRGRERERIIRANPDQAKALPGKVCTYCPLGKNFSCPIAEYNEYTALSPEDRLMWKVWMTKMNALNTPILKSFAEVQPDSTIGYKDGNGRVHEYGHLEVPTTLIALTPELMKKLDTYTELTGEDWRDWGLRVGSTELMSKLNANKRKPARGDLLKQLLEEGDIDGSQTKPAWAVRIVGEGIEPDYKREDAA